LVCYCETKSPGHIARTTKPVVPTAVAALPTATFPSPSESALHTARKPPTAVDALSSASATVVSTARNLLTVPAAQGALTRGDAFPSASEPRSVVTARRPMVVPVAKDVMLKLPF
jgi:hypothetical protein